MYVGRIVRDVKRNKVGQNGRVVNNVIAINHYQKDANGERRADFIPFVAWNHLADLLHNYTVKGQQIAITGKMQSRKYTDSDNNDRYVIECLVEELTLLQSRDSDDSKQKQTDNNQVEQTQSADIQIDEESIRAVMN